MSDTDLGTLLAFFKALSNESRLRIVGLLAVREHSVRELAELLNLTEPTVSHHLAALKSLDLVSARPEGVTRWHRLRLETLTKLNRSLIEPYAVAGLAAAKRPERGSEARIVEGYLDAEGRLKALPASRRKRLAVLKWLVGQFEEDRRYREAEVNDVLGRRFWDAATLRRELVIHRMMARDAGVYWRLPESDWLAMAAG